jgi:hypothetical protein
MEIRAIYDFCPELKTFITFDAKLGNGKTIPCVGHEWHCCDPECDCYLVNIMIDEANSGERLTQITYGWRNYAYYRKERFYEEDIRGFINGNLSFMEQRSEGNKGILAGFKTWLSSGYKQKVELFNKRYKQFKVICKSNDYDKEKELEEFFNAMHEVAKAGKLEEFIFNTKKG